MMAPYTVDTVTMVRGTSEVICCLACQGPMEPASWIGEDIVTWWCRYGCGRIWHLAAVPVGNGARR